MCHVVNLVLVQAHTFHEVDLDFIAGSDAPDKVSAAQPLMLGSSKQRWDIIPGVRVFSSQESVVVIQLADCSAIGKRGPFGRVSTIHTKYRGASLSYWVCLSHDAGRGYRATRYGRRAHGRIINNAVDDHIGGLGGNLYRIRGYFCHLVRQVLLIGEILSGFMGSYLVVLH